MRHVETLIHKALDGESLTARELQEFGAAMIADPDLAEEYVVLRRITRDALEARGARPSPGFSDRVMERIAQAPLPRPTGRPLAWSLVGATAALATVIVAAWIGSGALNWALARLQSAPSWRQAQVPAQFVVEQGRSLMDWVAGWDFGVWADGANVWLFWLAAPVLALMAGGECLDGPMGASRILIRHR